MEPAGLCFSGAERASYLFKKRVKHILSLKRKVDLIEKVAEQVTIVHAVPASIPVKVTTIIWTMEDGVKRPSLTYLTDLDSHSVWTVTGHGRDTTAACVITCHLLITNSALCAIKQIYFPYE